MRHLPLFGGDTRTPIELEPGAPVSSSCTRCDRSGAWVKPSGRAGGTLLLFDAPSRTGHPTKDQQRVISAAKAAGPVAVDFAVRCAGGKVTDDHVDACRAVTATVVASGWSRVICVGPEAARQILGMNAPTHDVRRCWASMSDGTPVVVLPPTWAAFRSKFTAKDLVEDVQWAMRAELRGPAGVSIRTVDTPEDAAACIDDLRGGVIFWDVETYGRMYDRDFRVAQLGVMRVGADTVWVWPDGAAVPGDPRCDVLQELGQMPAVAHNAEFDIRAMRAGPRVEMSNVVGDTQVMAKLMSPSEAGGLKGLAWKVGMGAHKDEMDAEVAKAVRILGLLRREAAKPITTEWTVERRTITRKDGKVTHQTRRTPAGERARTPEEAAAHVREVWSSVRSIAKARRTPAEYMGHPAGTPLPPDWLNAATTRADVEPKTYAYGLVSSDVAVPYVARDVVAGALLYEHLRAKLDTDKHEPQRRLWDSHVGRLAWTVSRIEDAGMLIDLEGLAAFESFLDREIGEVVRAIHDRAPGLDVASDDAVRSLLFDTLGMTPIELTKKSRKPSVSGDVLLQLSQHDPWVRHILQYRELAKLQSNYARGMRPWVQDDGRLHPHFNITGAESGRWSCHDPNLQTIPSRGQYAPRVKELFIAPPGYVIVQADYSTLELRIAAMLSKDEVMLDAFRRGVDLHRKTAQDVSVKLWGSPFDEADPKEQDRRRKISKSVNFGVVYGQHHTSLAFMTGLSDADAEAAQNAVIGNYKGLKAWIAATVARASRTGVTWTWWAGHRGRCRPVPDIGARSRSLVSHGQRQAYNTPVQGTGAEFCHASAAHIVPMIDREGLDAQTVLSVHDSLVFVCAEDDVPELAHIVQMAMTQWPSGDVELRVDVEAGPNWASLSRVA